MSGNTLGSYNKAIADILPSGSSKIRKLHVNNPAAELQSNLPSYGQIFFDDFIFMK